MLYRGTAGLAGELDKAALMHAMSAAEAFEGSRWWDNDPTLPAFLDNEPGQKSQPVTLNRMRQQRAGQLAGRAPAEGAKAEPVLQFCSMTPAVLARDQIVVDGLWPNICSATNEISAIGGRSSMRRGRPG